MIRGAALYDIIVGMGSPKKTRKSCERRGRRTRKGGGKNNSNNSNNSDRSNNSNSNSDEIDIILHNMKDNRTSIADINTQIDLLTTQLYKSINHTHKKDLQDQIDEKEKEKLIIQESIDKLEEYKKSYTDTNSNNTKWKKSEVVWAIKTLKDRKKQERLDRMSVEPTGDSVDMGDFLECCSLCPR